MCMWLLLLLGGGRFQCWLLKILPPLACPTTQRTQADIRRVEGAVPGSWFLALQPEHS